MDELIRRRPPAVVFSGAPVQRGRTRAGLRWFSLKSCITNATLTAKGGQRGVIDPTAEVLRVLPDGLEGTYQGGNQVEHVPWASVG